MLGWWNACGATSCGSSRSWSSRSEVWTTSNGHRSLRPRSGSRAGRSGRPPRSRQQGAADRRCRAFASRAGGGSSLRRRVAVRAAVVSGYRWLARDPEGHRLEDRRVRRTRLGYPREGWRRVLSAVQTFAHLDPALVNSLERGARPSGRNTPVNVAELLALRLSELGVRRAAGVRHWSPGHQAPIPRPVEPRSTSSTSRSPRSRSRVAARGCRRTHRRGRWPGPARRSAAAGSDPASLQ